MIKSIFDTYIESITTKFSYEETSEMGYKTNFEILLKGIFESINVTRFDHDSKSSGGNKPDFVIRKNNIPILYIEVKDIGTPLDKIEKSEQMARYFGYTNLVLTDYLEFRFYRNGLPYGEPITIGSCDKKKRVINPNPQDFDNLKQTLLDFAQSHKEPIRSGAHLSKIMGGKAQRIRDNVRYLLRENSAKDPELFKLYGAVKSMLVHDLTEHTFADMYAQTLVYGLFVARYHDKTPDNFTRSEARELIPNSNKFLKHFFDHIVGIDFKSSLKFIVDELCEVYSHADVNKLMEDYFKTSKESTNDYDPVIHFYEDFLKEYDPELRKTMGAYYTPQPVVSFIVKSVDEILKKEFSLNKGISDTTKLANGKHKVQILDFATGTGTFISTIIREIYIPFKRDCQEGRWPSYVHNDLLPRIHGFELMMAPYTIAHLRLGIAFKKTGFWDFHRRLGIYLTNTLDEGDKQQLPMAFGLAESIAEESKEASIIKNETPIMVVIGNPPYSGESSNAQYKGHDVYKFEPTGEKLQERNSKWINDDYVKFFRFAESMIEKTGEGIIAMITANGYIDNPTFRGMRWHLMNSLDQINIIDLHGSTNKKEVSPDGSEDQNVFDIKTGVSIIFGIKRKSKETKLAKIYHADLYGKRTIKFKYLNENTINTVKWEKVIPIGKNYEWVARDEELRKSYDLGFSINEIFLEKGVGIITARDSFVISTNTERLIKNAQKFSESEATTQANICAEVGISDKKGWNAIEARNKLRTATNLEDYIRDIAYRIFDERKIFYHPALIWRTVEKIMKHFLNENIALVSCRQVIGDEWAHVFLTSKIVDDSYLSNRTRERGYVFPLYQYKGDALKISNFKKEIINKIEDNVGHVSPEDVFNYIYAILHSLNYRKKYKEFLKIDFPKIPFPKNADQFKKLAKIGQELRQIHLFKTPVVNKLIITYPESGSDTIEKITFKEDRVYVNDKQYFGNIPELAWNFHIGGYQPAQKWLKDRKGHVLTNEDIEHYQKVIVVLVETDKLMKEIDKNWQQR